MSRHFTHENTKRKKERQTDIERETDRERVIETNRER
jgi:hypothetical protein